MACGQCCRLFNVPLKGIEIARLSKIFGTDIFDYKKKPGTAYLKRLPNGKCIFQYNNFGYNLCAIQELKPLACKIFPFFIFKSFNKEAQYIYKGVSYNVYLNRACCAIKFGKPSAKFVYKTIPEAIKLTINPYHKLKELTCKNINFFKHFPYLY
ncbi:MAG: YkgJ family cysteine cluster protein [Promethearchaeota archaeon]